MVLMNFGLITLFLFELIQDLVNAMFLLCSGIIKKLKKLFFNIYWFKYVDKKVFLFVTNRKTVTDLIFKRLQNYFFKLIK